MPTLQTIRGEHQRPPAAWWLLISNKQKRECMEWACLHPCPIISNTLHDAWYVTLSLQQPPVRWKGNEVRPPSPTRGFGFNNLFEGCITVTVEEHPSWMLRLRQKNQIIPTTSHNLWILHETSRSKFRSKAETLWRSRSLGEPGSAGHCQEGVYHHRPRRSMLRRNDGRRDTATGTLGETAAAIASSQMHCTIKQRRALLYVIFTHC